MAKAVEPGGVLGARKLTIPPFPRLAHSRSSELKEINTWPTFPQLIIKGEFVGGLDVVQEMVENGEFKEMLA